MPDTHAQNLHCSTTALSSKLRNRRIVVIGGDIKDCETNVKAVAPRWKSDEKVHRIMNWVKSADRLIRAINLLPAHSFEHFLN